MLRSSHFPQLEVFESDLKAFVFRSGGKHSAGNFIETSVKVRQADSLPFVVDIGFDEEVLSGARYAEFSLKNSVGKS